MNTDTNIYIRPAEESDLPAIRQILNEVIARHSYNLSGKPKTMEEMAEWFNEHANNERYAIFAAISDGNFAGWISLSPFRPSDGYDTTAELSVYVHPDYYQKKIGSTLMQYIEEYARSKGLLHCIISVITADNLTSISLHKKLGYAINGIFNEIGIKGGKYYDVVMMTKLI
jgi:L-amino acid N-acyltransferase YncA